MRPYRYARIAEQGHSAIFVPTVTDLHELAQSTGKVIEIREDTDIIAGSFDPPTEEEFATTQPSPWVNQNLPYVD